MSAARPELAPLVRPLLEFYAELRYGPSGSVTRARDVAEFARRMEQEMDFRAEAAHIGRFGEQFANEPTIYVPIVFPDTSTGRILTMERIEAVISGIDSTVPLTSRMA